MRIQGCLPSLGKPQPFEISKDFTKAFVRVYAIFRKCESDREEARRKARQLGWLGLSHKPSHMRHLR